MISSVMICMFVDSSGVENRVLLQICMQLFDLYMFPPSEWQSHWELVDLYVNPFRLDGTMYGYCVTLRLP